MWKESFPPILERYLFAQIRPASSASEDSCSYSLETKCTHKGNSSTPAFLRPKSKIRICYVSTSLLKRIAEGLLPWGRGHLDCNGIWDTACSCLFQLEYETKRG